LQKSQGFAGGERNKNEFHRTVKGGGYTDPYMDAGSRRRPAESPRRPAKSGGGGRYNRGRRDDSDSDCEDYSTREARRRGAREALAGRDLQGARPNGDVSQLGIDPNLDWSSVGGNEAHVKQLHEMVVLPMLYPEVFSRFHITPPRGVIFYGPPGTGKTLMARVLANVCGKAGQPVSFFMRKGADCLSKWVGEAERQLRILFEEVLRALLMNLCCLTSFVRCCSPGKAMPAFHHLFRRDRRTRPCKALPPDFHLPSHMCHRAPR
jgi:hypothetical protein